MRILAVSALLLASVASPAFAQESQDTQSERPFNGLYVGAVVGADSSSDGVDSAIGAIGGVTVGYDMNIGNAVVGLEGEATMSSARQCENDTLVAGDELCSKPGRDLYAGVRIGLVDKGTTLIYLKGGYTNAEARSEYTGGAADVTTTETLDGVRAGLGVESMLGSNLSIRGEVRYSNYEQGIERYQGVMGLNFRF